METATRLRPTTLETTELAGKIAVVTGGTTGIGRATAVALASRGVKTVIYGRHQPELDEALAELRQTGGEGHGLIADNAYEEQIAHVFHEARERYGDIDILINNAAIPAHSILEVPYDQALYALRVDLLGYLACMRQAVEMMRRKGSGHIVNIGSLSAIVRERGADLYVAGKAAIEAVSESIRKVIYEQRIRLSLIEPGNVGTNLHGEPRNVEEQRRMQDEGSMMKPEDIAAAVLYILTQPFRVNVLELRIAPTMQGL